jgi:hypothetical protein
MRARGCERTAIWWPYSCGRVSIARPIVIRIKVYLEANSAQVAQCSHKRRHGGGWSVQCR